MIDAIMKPKSIEQQLESLNIHPDEIPDEDISDAINLLFQLIEELHIDNEKLKTENQKLRDENNLLKGEQGKPDIPSSNPSSSVSHLNLTFSVCK